MPKTILNAIWFRIHFSFSIHSWVSLMSIVLSVFLLDYTDLDILDIYGFNLTWFCISSLKRNNPQRILITLPRSAKNKKQNRYEWVLWRQFCANHLSKKKKRWEIKKWSIRIMLCNEKSVIYIMLRYVKI